MAEPPRTAATSRSQDVRARNTAVVLRSLREHGAASRADLAVRTGLAKGTVGTIVAELAEVGAVLERPTASADGVRGRPSRPVTLDGGDLVGVGIEVNVDYRALVAMDLAGDVRLVDDEPAGPPDDALADAGAYAARCLDRVRAAGLRPLALTVAVPGLVERDRRTVRDAPNLGWHGVDLAAAVERGVGDGVRVSVDNDANCAVRAEASVGAAVGTADVLYVTGTVGVGGGVLSEGRVLRGHEGFAGEVGHLPLTSSDAVCACGRRGCWETAVGLRALQRRTGLREDDQADPLAVATHVATEAATDVRVQEGVASLAADLGRGCALLATLLDPGTIVLGGWYAVLADFLLPVVGARLDDAVARCRVVPSTLGLRAAATGAAAGVVGDVLDARLPIALAAEEIVGPGR